MKHLLALGMVFFGSICMANSPLTVQTLGNGRTVLGDNAGLSLYTFKPDKTNESVCYDSCAATWPPVLLNGDEPLSGSLSSSVRRDGSRQLTVDGRPVYLFVGDQKPGDAAGEGLGGVWFVLEVSIKR